jgi:hypothetical protein
MRILARIQSKFHSIFNVLCHACEKRQGNIYCLHPVVWCNNLLILPLTQQMCTNILTVMNKSNVKNQYWLVIFVNVPCVSGKISKVKQDGYVSLCTARIETLHGVSCTYVELLPRSFTDFVSNANWSCHTLQLYSVLGGTQEHNKHSQSQKLLPGSITWAHNLQNTKEAVTISFHLLGEHCASPCKHERGQDGWS